MADSDQLTTTHRSAQGSRFAQTSLTLLRQVQAGDGQALEELCSRYWYPLYTWLLASGTAPNHAAAQDYVQGFFEKMLGQGNLVAHQPERGRFRSYLLTCLKNHAIDLIRKRRLVLVEPPPDEPDWLGNVATQEVADAAFRKAWAWDLVEAAKGRLRHEWQGAGQVELFDAFAPYLEGNRCDEGLEAIAERFGLSHDNARQRLHRLRKPLREIITTLVLAELPDDASPGDRAAEMQTFMESLAL